MTDRYRFEQEVLTAVRQIVAAAQPALAKRGVELDALELISVGEGAEYESELRLYAYRDGQIWDALEVHAWRGGQPGGTVEELSDWFRTQLISLEGA